MKLSLAHRLLLLAVPVLPVFTTATMSAYAATLSLSGSSTTLDSFVPLAGEVSASTETITEAKATGDGAVQAEAEANANLTPDSGDSDALGVTSGTGFDYEGLASGKAQVSGLFSVKTKESFSFNFLSRLTLVTAVDDPAKESAEAFGEIRFNLFDNDSGNLLDSFGLFGSLNSRSPVSDPIRFTPSTHLTLFDSDQDFDSQDNFFAASKQISGTYSRQFASATNVRLEATAFNKSNVSQVPEPAFMLGSGAFGLLLMYRKCVSGRKREEMRQLLTQNSEV